MTCIWRMRRRRARGDGGFTLIELMVAIVIFALVVSAATGLTVMTLKAALFSRARTQAKEIASQAVESAIELPFHVASSTIQQGGLLNLYYPNATAPQPATISCGSGPGAWGVPKSSPAASSWTGYVGTNGQRCSYEPATGDFYRTVKPCVAAGPGSTLYFTPVLDVQFLKTDATTGLAGPAPAVSASWNANTGSAAPPASQVGITLTVVYGNRTGCNGPAAGPQRAVTNYTQMTQRANSPLTSASANAKILEVATKLLGSLGDGSDDVGLTAGVGVISALGETSSQSRASLLAKAAQIADSLGNTTSNGALVNDVAPPDTIVSAAAPGTAETFTTPLSLGGGDFGGSSVSAYNIAASPALPSVGVQSPSAWVTASMNAAASGNVFEFGSGGSAVPGSTQLAPFSASVPVVAIAATPAVTAVVGTIGDSANPCPTWPTLTTPALGAAWVSTTQNNVIACATGASGYINLFGGAASGGLTVQVVNEYAQCIVAGTGGQQTWGTFDIKIWDQTTPVGGTPLVELKPQSGNGSVNQNALNSKLGASPAKVYLSGWSAVDGFTASASTQSLVPLTLTSNPTRTLVTPTGLADTASSVSISIGGLSCSAGDNR